MTAVRVLLAALACAVVLGAGDVAIRLGRSARQRALEAEPAYRAYRERAAELARFYETTRRKRKHCPRENVPGVRAVLRGVTYAYNDEGLRDDRPAPRVKPPGERRVALLGDSVAQGLYVPVEATCARAMERHLPATRVLNFAVDGLATLEEYMVFEQRALAFAPDAAVLLVCMDDLFERARVGEPAPPPDRLAAWRERSAVLDFVLDHLTTTALPGVSWDAFAHNFTALADLARRRGVPLVVAVAPLFPAGAAPWAPYERRVRELAQASGARAVDLWPRFAGPGAERLFVTPEESFLYPRDHWHPSAAGHAIIGAALADAVRALPPWH